MEFTENALQVACNALKYSEQTMLKRIKDGNAGVMINVTENGVTKRMSACEAHLIELRSAIAEFEKNGIC